MSKRPRTTAPKSDWKKKQVKKKDPLDRWALEPGFKANLKRCDVSINSYFTPTASTAGVNLCAISQSVGDNGRVGQRVRLHNLTIRGLISYFPQATAIQQPDFLRLMIVYDRQTNGVAPPYSNVVTQINTGTSFPYDPPNWYERGRYKILRDWMIATPAMNGVVAAGLLAAGTTQMSPPQPTSMEFNLHFFKALKGKIDTIYSGTGSTAANINGGGIFVMAQNLGAGTGWVYELTSALEFSDV